MSGIVLINIENIIFKKYDIKIKAKPFGENVFRNNVFLGVSANQQYIIKVEDLNNLSNVKLATKMAMVLKKSTQVYSSQYIMNNNKKLFSMFKSKIITLQKKENLTKILLNSRNDYIKLGEVIGEFHQLVSHVEYKGIRESDFYNDFMYGEVPKAQTLERLEEIENFYKLHTPNYQHLTKGIIHNDLNLNNILKAENKYFIIDFEHVKIGPLISDLGVLILELWNKELGVKDYLNKLNWVVKGYENISKLTDYDKSNIVIFSMRYLMSDENWYIYWSKKGNSDVMKLIPEVIEKQKLLWKMI